MISDKEYKKLLKQFHKLSDRHILVVETDMPSSDVQKVVILSDKIRKAGNELVGLMRKNYDQLMRTKKYRKLLKLYGSTNDKKKHRDLANQLNEMQKQYNVTWDHCRNAMIHIGKKYSIDAVFALTKAEDIWRGIEKFDLKFPKMPGYTRRAIIADAFGMVKSYRSNHKNWKETPPMERGAEPTLGIPSRYELTFYDQERKMSCLADSQIGLKLYNGKTWNWYYFQIRPSDAKQISRLSKTRKMLSPIVDKVRGRYQIRFTFEEIRELVQDEDKLAYRVLAVDLGINAAASWCVMEADGTVHAKGVIHLPCEEDRLNHMINRKRMYQQAGKKSHCAYRWIREANRQLSIQTTKALMDVAVLYSVDCIVFEHLDSKGKIRGRRYRERIHLWRKNDVQHRVELQAHRMGMRLSHVCAWGTSKYAFDGSGVVDRHSIYHYEHGRKVYNYSLCMFQNGKIYNCDLSAAQNIGARFFLREYQLLGIEGLPATPQRTLCTLRILVSNGLPVAA